MNEKKKKKEKKCLVSICMDLLNNQKVGDNSLIICVRAQMRLRSIIIERNFQMIIKLIEDGTVY